jgi:amidase
MWKTSCGPVTIDFIQEQAGITMSNTKPENERKLTRREMAALLGTGLLGSAVPLRADEAGRNTAQPVQPRVRPAGELLSASVAGIAAALARGQVSSLELVTAYLERIEAVNPAINAVVHVDAERALEHAKRADAVRRAGQAAGPLLGIPITLKDSIDTEGMVTTYGTRGRKDHRPQRDATVAKRLKKAGAILLGKTNTPEFTLSFETDNLVYGRTRNPFDPERTSGGSSGGAAAAVTSALCAFDIGSDTGGSIRQPSHCCGTAGLKPTQGRVPRTGHAISFGGIHDQLTQLGPIARSVEDLELVFRIISGPDGRDPFIAPVPVRDSRQVELAGLRVGWHADNGIFTPSDDIMGVVAAAARVLEKAGAAIREVVPDPLPGTMAELDRNFVWNNDGGAWIRRLLDSAGTTQPHPAIAVQIDAKWLVETGELTALMESRDRFRSDMLAFMQDYDVMITPVVGFTAPPFGQTEDEAHFPGYTYTQVYNLTGQPAVVVRCGRSPEGLPIGVQVAAQPWREDVALAVARHLEEVFGGWSPPA